jgi:hypothetical protein
MFDEREGWVLFPGDTREWREIPLAEIEMNTRGEMSEAEFKRIFGQLPVLPKAAFSR